MLSDYEISDTESLHQLTINEHYAKAFEYKKEREELQKLKDQYGSDLEDEDVYETDSESDETEDEDGEELTPNVDVAILRTLARIKRKDPDIYDTSKNVFGEEQTKINPATKPLKTPKTKSKPVTIRQVALQSALRPDYRSPSPEPLPHVEEQRILRDETIAMFHRAVDGDENEDALLIPREKTKDQQEKEEEEYRTFLEREVGEDLSQLVTTNGDASVEDSPTIDVAPKKLKKKGRKEKSEASKETAPAKSTQDSNQEFLMNYILNRGWIDRSANRIPTYGEITSPKSKTKKKAQRGESVAGSDSGEDKPTVNPEPDSDDEDFEEVADLFETSYNFRFEEPDPAVIPAYPRNVPSLVRRQEPKRKEARERRKQRKEEELLKRKEEVKRLKGLKMKDIRLKLERIGREGGKNIEQDQALQKLDLDSEWDPAAHDRQMAELYDNDNDFAEDEKPHWDEDIDVGDINVDVGVSTMKDKKKKKKKKKRDMEDEEDVGVDVDAMDADIERPNDDEEWDGTEEMRKKKLDEYMEEIYGLDFNDLVGDLPTRFKYVPVQAENFSLTPTEILMATDQELNEYMSVKRYAPYRASKWDSRRNDRLKEFKSKLQERMGNNSLNLDCGEDLLSSGKPVKKRMGKKERLRLKAVQDDAHANVVVEDADRLAKRPSDVDGLQEGGYEDNAKKKKRRRKHEVS